MKLMWSRAIAAVLLLFGILMKQGNSQNTTELTEERPQGSPRSPEAVLKSALLENYDTTSRPVINDEDTVQARIGISLFHLMHVNEKQQTVHAAYSFRFSWTDHFLRWNESVYKVSTMFIPASRIWRPDIMVLNTAMDELFEFLDTNAIVSPDGNVLWMVPFTPVTTCSIDVRYYPFDIQHCELTFISWTYSGKQLNLSKHPAADAIYYSSANQEWDVTEIEAERHDKIYACCPNDPYPDVTFKLHMRRRSLFYVINLVLPSLLIYALAIIGFFLPNADKVSMETTVLLTLVVYLMMISDTMPPTPDSVPVLSLLFLLILLLVALAIVMAVIVTYLAERPRFSPLPKWGKLVIRVMFKKHYYHPSIQASLSLARLRRTQPDFREMNQFSVNSEETEQTNETARAHMNGTSNGNGVQLVTCRSCSNNCLADHNLNGKELTDWQLLAEALDRLFYYVFLLLSAAMLIMFAAMIFPAMVKSLSGTST